MNHEDQIPLELAIAPVARTPPARSAVYLIRTELRPLAREATAIQAPRDAAEIISREIGNKDREHLVALHLNTQRQLSAIEVVAIGNLNSAIVHPREVFKAAILNNAAAIILGHNHPSGDTTPSSDDRLICQQIVAAGRLLDIL